MGMKSWLILQKYRFDLSYAFLAIINFALLIIALSDNIRTNLGLTISPMMVSGILVLSCFLIVWFLGYALDKIRYPQEKSVVENTRNVVLMEVLERVKKIEEKIK